MLFFWRPRNHYIKVGDDHPHGEISGKRLSIHLEHMQPLIRFPNILEFFLSTITDSLR